MHPGHGMDVIVRGPFFKPLQRTFPISNNICPHRALFLYLEHFMDIDLVCSHQYNRYHSLP